VSRNVLFVNETKLQYLLELVTFRLSHLNLLLIQSTTKFVRKLARPLTTASTYSTLTLNLSDSAEQDMKDLKTCLAALKEFLECFLSLPVMEYMKFSGAEWARLVLAIQASSQICFLPSSSTTSTEHTVLLERERAKILIYFESLSHRLEKLSQSFRSPSEPPDHFLLFNSILQITSSAYLPGSNVRPQPASQGLLSYNQGKSSKTQSRCPILNGEIRQTEYWNALKNNRIDSESGTEGLDVDAADLDMPSFFDDIFDGSQSSSDLFSTWAVSSDDVDFNNAT
jgi:hypothetical protein